jgi:hypothetical protein
MVALTVKLYTAIVCTQQDANLKDNLFCLGSLPYNITEFRPIEHQQF